MKNTIDIIMPKSVKAFREFVVANNKNPTLMATLCIVTLRLCQYDKKKSFKKIEILYGPENGPTSDEAKDLQTKFHVSVNGDCEIDEDEEDTSEYMLTNLDVDFTVGEFMTSAKAVMQGFVIFVWLKRHGEDEWFLSKYLIMSEEDCVNFLAMRHPTKNDWVSDPSKLGNLNQVEGQPVDEQLLF